jgi:toluene monooxygenase system protein D
MTPHATNVGPVLLAGAVTDAVVRAIKDLNENASVLDRGSYVRVSVPGRCVLTREAVEGHLGREFRLPMDLELVMPSFSGAFSVDERGAVWTA